MLVNLKEILDMAEKSSFAVPAFNVYNLETVMGIFKAAEETCAPVIIQVYSRLMKEQTGYFLSPAILAAAKKARVPICFHLDHASSELETTRALRYGATGIMLDGSTLPFADNIALTKRVVDTCAHLGVQVEGELGHVGSVLDAEMDPFTIPSDAAFFVKETGVSCLAVAVGTAHGRYSKPPKLDIERIRAIRKATGNVPLVLHGGSGVPDEEVKMAVEAGVRKLNVATDICYSFLDACHVELSKPDHPVALDVFMKSPIESVKNFAIEKIRLVGAEGKA